MLQTLQDQMQLKLYDVLNQHYYSIIVPVNMVELYYITHIISNMFSNANIYIYTRDCNNSAPTFINQDHVEYWPKAINQLDRRLTICHHRGSIFDCAISSKNASL